jgi:hypothetical protein
VAAKTFVNGKGDEPDQHGSNECGGRKHHARVVQY